MKTLNSILFFLGALASLLMADVKFITDAMQAFPAGNIMVGLQDVCYAVGATAGFFHLHIKFSLFGLNIDTGNN